MKKQYSAAGTSVQAAEYCFLLFVGKGLIWAYPGYFGGTASALRFEATSGITSHKFYL